MEAHNRVLPVEIRAIASALRLPAPSKHAMVVLLALAVGAALWAMPPGAPLEANGMHFLATMVVAVVFWVFDVIDDYIVGLLLLLSWVVLGIVPAKIALAGFSENSWFFTVGALAMAAAIGKTSLPQRLSTKLLRWIPIHCRKTYTFFLLSVGALTAPLLPSGKARAAVALPISQSIAQAAGFAPRSNGSAAVSLAALVGFTEIQFLFLTGADQCLISWNFLPAPLKAEFGWLRWFLAALPAALLIAVFMLIAVHYLLPLSRQEVEQLSNHNETASLVSHEPLTAKEWVALVTLAATVLGWLTTGLHGISEAWVALAALVIFLMSGILEKNSFRNDLDWGLILFFGVLNSLAPIAEHLKVDAWLMAASNEFLGRFSSQPLVFLFFVFLFVAAVRFLLRKTPTAVLFGISILPLSQSVGIHPGVLIIVALMAGECFLLGYQDGPYQIAYGGGRSTAFSHAQARKILAAKYLATLLAIAICIPYWQVLGLIR